MTPTSRTLTAQEAIRHVAEHYEWRFQKGLSCQQTLETAIHRLKSHIEPFLGSIDSGSPKEAPNHPIRRRPLRQRPSIPHL